MASFQAKIGWKRPKIAKKFKKLKNTIMASFQAKISWERPRKREKKNFIVSLRPYLTDNLKFQRNCKKIQKIKKSQYGFI